MNNITIAGNITSDIEVRTVGNDIVGSFSVADNQGKDKNAIFWKCQLWGKRASLDSLGQYLTKGQTVTISGNVTEREFTDKDGNKRKNIDVRVQDLALQGGKRESAPEPVRQRPAATPASRAGGFPDPDFGDEIIPF